MDHEKEPVSLHRFNKRGKKESKEASGIPVKRSKRSAVNSFENSTELPDRYENLSSAQRGLFDLRHKYGVFVSIKQDKITFNKCENIVTMFKELYSNTLAMTDHRTRIHIAFDPKLWRQYKPGRDLEQRPKGDYLLDSTQKFVNTGGDVFFYIKSDEKVLSDQVLEELMEKLERIGLKETDYNVTKSNEYGNTGIINGSFREGLANLSDRGSVDQYILIGENGKGEIGGTYLMTQKFRTCWEILESKSQSAKEELIGRKMFELGIIPTVDKSSHIKRAHKLDDFPPPCSVTKGLRRIFRQSMPYGSCESQPGREAGTFYVSYANSTDTIKDILKNLSGCPGTTSDAFLDVFSAIEGSFWYVPSIKELGILPSGISRVDLDKQWLVQRKNKYIFYNHKQYLHDMEKNLDDSSFDDPVSPRVLRLLQYMFEQWNNVWFKKVDIPDIPDLSHVLEGKEKNILQASIPLRKGMAIKKSLGELFTTADISTKLSESSTFYGWKADLFNIHPDEIIVGRMPKGSTLGLGKKVMKYLNTEERMTFYLLGLSEVSAVGHVIPNHSKLLSLGVSGLIEDIKRRKTQRKDKADQTQKEFFDSCISAMEGVQMYIANFGKLAGYLSNLDKEYSTAQRENLAVIQKRMNHLSKGAPRDLTEAAQLIFSMHCCLHLIGQPVAVGRLDELLAPYIERSTDSLLSNQEIIDCFWIKFGERVILDPHNASDSTSWGNCAVPYSSDGTFPRGDSLNQWVQQITVGGYHDSTIPKTGMKDIALLCLKAARRLPLNAPCLSLRLYRDIDEDILREAAKAILSGGAHPILLHDDRIIPALKSSPRLQKTPMKDSDVKNYACDGCYEPLIAGKSEFTFTYIPLPKILELAINQGDTYVLAGPAYLQGVPSSYRSEPASDINSFQKLKEIFTIHLQVQIEQALYKLLMNYGNIWKACPAPLLSSVIDGCLETGRDLYNGGATYLIAACMFIGFSNCVDSLYSIKRLCFDNATACLSLKELLSALKNDWGFDMEEPFVDDNAGKIRTTEKSTQYQTLREQVLAFPKFGTDAGVDDVTIQDIVRWLSDLVTSTFRNVVENSKETDPLHTLFERLKKDFSAPGAPFDCLFCPGSGTFEGYVGWGLSLGASADGRRKTMPIASDFSAAPVIQDGPWKPKQNNIYKSLANWNYESIKRGFSNGAEVDLNIHEDFPEEDLFDFLREYADGEGVGANIITMTCADEDTYQNAYKDSEKYDLIRVRMGGWSEHFVAMFNAHKKQHMRRAYYQP